ncbi:MAG: Eco57I restriction-modification methylase domain-containing protein [Gemmatimonadota bacterium]
MRTDLTSIRDVVDDAFRTRSLAPLLALLGFAGDAVPLGDMESPVWYCGGRGTLACYAAHGDADIPRLARTLRARNYAQLQLYVFARPDFSAIVVASFGLGEQLLTLTLQRARLHASDLAALHELTPAADERGTALAARHGRALDRSRVTKRFFADFAAQRAAVAAAWLGPDARQRRDREQLALLLLSRLMFLYFLQHRGYLAGDSEYLIRRFRAWHSRRTFYAGVLKPLFFYVLNRRTEQRPARAAGFGDLPYLNGGLFERHALERKHTRLDLPDATVTSVFDDLLEHYRFTAREAADTRIDGVCDVGVDPEMLGRVFEGLMPERVRATTGTFYTPAATVDRLVCATLDAYVGPSKSTSRALREAKVLDPACGSGAFLLAALARIAQRRAAADGNDILHARRETVAHSLYGVDLQSDAALLCALRLWLALVPGEQAGTVQPLPNLDRQIRQGDSLVDPLDLRVGGASTEVRQWLNRLQPAARAYAASEPEERPRLQRTLLHAERHLARSWVSTQQQRIARELAELRAASGQKDLFGSLTEEARLARDEISRVRERAVELKRARTEMSAKDERPFFSFAVHFPDAALHGFDIVLCNPPWVRSHNWPRSITAMVRRRYAVCRANGGGHQIDLAMLFLERALDLLAPSGALGIILPAKFMRSLSGASARQLLLEQADIISIEDHSLDQRSIFQADAFAAVIVARKRGPDAVPASHVATTMIRRGGAPLVFSTSQGDLPFVRDDLRAPWLLVPGDVRSALSRMQAAPMLGSFPELHVRRGVVSGENALMLLTHVDAKLAGLAAIRCEGRTGAAHAAAYEGIVERAAIAPVIRGCDVAAWSLRRERWLLCRRPETPKQLPRLSSFLAKHGCDLRSVPKTPAPCTSVAWHDLASTLQAVVLPVDVVAINTVYFIHLPEDDAHLLCAYFNSLPLRAFARAIAERAKDAHFRFFAWTVSMLPLPREWRSFERERLIALSRAAHSRGELTESTQRGLNATIARAYGLASSELRALDRFDRWLKGS